MPGGKQQGGQTRDPLRASSWCHHKHGWHSSVWSPRSHLHRSSQRLWPQLWTDSHHQVHYTCFVRVKGFYERHSPPVDEIWSTTVLLLSSSRQTKLHWQKQQFHLTDNHKMQLMQTWQKQYKTHQNHLGLCFYCSKNHQLWFGWNKPIFHKVICEYILALYIITFYNCNIFCFVKSC